MKNMTETISRYVSAWNETTPEAVMAALTECCAPELTYTDKDTRTYTEHHTPVLEGIDQLTTLVMGSHTKVPGRTFSMLTVPQYFDGHCHYSWGVQIPGETEKAGWDYISYNEENLITHIIGFLPVKS